MTRTAEHPSREQLIAFGQGRLDVDAAETIAGHVADCDTCCDVLSELPPDTLVDRVRASEADTTIDGRVSAPAEDHDPSLIPRDLADHPRYRIVRVLGAGGMGTVYQAEHRVMDRPVALKVINRQLTSDPEIVERFRQEVRAAAKLSHPNIVTAHDAEQTGDLHFLVMEYVDGIDLARYAKKKGPLAAGLVAHIGRQAALGLNHAAGHHMVHRDIKPQNLIVTRSGHVRILDFGLARLGRKERERPAASDDDQLRRSAEALTLAGSILGTPDYIAPEQAADSRSADIRSDIYSLGCTLYFLLTGQPPYPGGSVYSKLMAHQTQSAQSLAELRGDIPPPLLRVVERMMSRAPDDRYQSPAEVAKALQPIAKEWQKSGSKTDAPAEERPNRSGTAAANVTQPAVTQMLATDEVDTEELSTKSPQSAGFALSQFGAKKHAAIAGCAILLAVFLAWLWTLSGDDSSESTPPMLIGPADQSTVQGLQRAWAAQLGMDDIEVRASLPSRADLVLKVIPPGQFRDNAGSGLQQVRSQSPLLFAETEITGAQFQSFADDTGYVTEAEKTEGWGLVDGRWERAQGYSWRNGGSFTPGPDHPATNISWNDATEFCNWLNERVPEVGGLEVRWRLANEWEWEFACRSGSSARFYWGNNAELLGSHAVTSANSGARVAPVKSKRPNTLGLYDMLGNESEWCQNPSGNGSLYVQRGGSFLHAPYDIHCATRDERAPSKPDHGAFRVVAEPQ